MVLWMVFNLDGIQIDIPLSLMPINFLICMILFNVNCLRCTVIFSIYFFWKYFRLIQASARHGCRNGEGGMISRKNAAAMGTKIWQKYGISGGQLTALFCL